jgi:hypothetical protein
VTIERAAKRLTMAQNWDAPLAERVGHLRAAGRDIKVAITTLERAMDEEEPGQEQLPLPAPRPPSPEVRIDGSGVVQTPADAAISAPAAPSFVRPEIPDMEPPHQNLAVESVEMARDLDVDLTVARQGEDDGDALAGNAERAAAAAAAGGSDPDWEPA